MTSLPVDATTILGMLVIQATLLPTTSFGDEGATECLSVLQCIEEHMSINGTLPILPHSELFGVDVQDNMVNLSTFRSCLEELCLRWSRLAVRSYAGS